VLAATYSAQDDLLWIVDELSLGKHKPKLRRIVTLDPDTHQLDVLGVWPSVGPLRRARSGSIATDPCRSSRRARS
jgi:hypothetical protein